MAPGLSCKRGPFFQKKHDFGHFVDKVLVIFLHETFHTPSGEWVEVNYAHFFALADIWILAKVSAWILAKVYAGPPNVAPAKNEQEPPTKSGRRYLSTKKTGTVYEPQRVRHPCFQDQANVIAKLSVKLRAEMQEEQRVPGHGRAFKGCGWYWTTNKRHQKGVLEMGSLWGYVGPQSATEWWCPEGEQAPATSDIFPVSGADVGSNIRRVGARLDAPNLPPKNITSNSWVWRPKGTVALYSNTLT